MQIRDLDALCFANECNFDRFYFKNHKNRLFLKIKSSCRHLKLIIEKTNEVSKAATIQFVFYFACNCHFYRYVLKTVLYVKTLSTQNIFYFFANFYFDIYNLLESVSFTIPLYNERKGWNEEINKDLYVLLLSRKS